MRLNLYKLIIYTLAIIITLSNFTYAISINVSLYNNNNNTAKIPINKDYYIHSGTEINLYNCSYVNNIIVDFLNVKTHLQSLKVNCLSSSSISFHNDANLTINNLYLENLSFQNQPLAAIENLYINSSKYIKTALPKNSNSININIQPSEDMTKAGSLIKAINIIPGSGEFVYDSKIIYEDRNGTLKPINMNNAANTADSVYNLLQLKSTCPNLEWASPVISWFIHNKNNNYDDNSLDIKNLSIKPAIMGRTSNIIEPWHVGEYSRVNAHKVSKDADGNISYGGTINDQSLIRYVDLLTSKNLKIMFYPMLMLDLPNKPWRGSIIASSTADVIDFFNKKDGGYNQFILHYAHLLKGKVKAFVIGSELQNLTNFIDHNYNYPSAQRYPAVVELTKLAKQVKKIMGNDVTITYAANWGEYHHSLDGYFNLDSLWASPYIDVVGIDAYLPLTQHKMSDITYDDIVKGWESGELWDYYYNTNSKVPLPIQAGLKRIEYWWSNEHIKDNIKSEWVPKMKPIWFTEFGFASMHMTTSQPHIFHDHNNKNSTLPKYSSGNEDFQLQAKAIRGTLEYWQKKSDIVQNMFLWAWDARPYPAFPKNLSLWKDGTAWAKGHWINAKLDPDLTIDITSSFVTNQFNSNAVTCNTNPKKYCKIKNGNNKCNICLKKPFIFST